MATRSKPQSSSNRSAFSWTSENAGPLIGAAAAGAALAYAFHFGRKAVIQGMEARAGDWEDMLKKDHEEILGLFDQMLATDSSQTFKRSALLMKLSHKLDKHAYEEESVVYPALREDDFETEADQLDTEHGQVKTFLFDLKQMEGASPNWLETVRKFRGHVAQHIRKEEREVFPELKKDLDEQTNKKITGMVNKAGFMMA